VLMPPAPPASVGRDAIQTPLMPARLAFRDVLPGISLPEILGAGD
jgi:hypothetical protein